MVKNYLRRIVREELKELLADRELIDEPIEDPDGGGVVLEDMTEAEYLEYREMEERGWKGFYSKLRERIYGKN